MNEEKIKTLWGQDFRVVAEGLAETDVVIFFEKLIREHREKLKQLDHVSSLHELATKTVEDAQGLASTIEEEAEATAQARAEQTTRDAQDRAKTIIEEARQAAQELAQHARATLSAMEDEYRRGLHDQIAKIDSALKEVSDAAELELSARMTSHYIGKFLSQSVHFIPAFENLIKEVRATVSSSPSNSDSSPTAP